jgi:D-beta-D-heptose 7-phosphate kinase/D-beta-D-heptose 1-phosphate adenosyltransferase
MKNHKIINRQELKKLGQKLRREKKKIVFTAGCFDLIHVGHARYLAKAKSLGDVLIVGLAGNQAVRQMKGSSRPIIDEKVRGEMLAFLEPVDYVHIHKEKTASTALKSLKPDILLMVEGDWEERFDENDDVKAAKLNGTKIVVVPRQAPYLSTSAIIERVVGAEVQVLFRKYLANSKKTLSD